MGAPADALAAAGGAAAALALRAHATAAACERHQRHAAERELEVLRLDGDAPRAELSARAPLHGAAAAAPAAPGELPVRVRAVQLPRAHPAELRPAAGAEDPAAPAGPRRGGRYAGAAGSDRRAHPA